MTTNNNTRTPAKARDRLEAAEAQTLRTDSLVGSFFHSRSDNGWQGCVVAEPAPGIYLVELFEWIVGSSNDQQLVALADMSGWRFCDDAKWMNNSYANGVQRRWEHERQTPEQQESITSVQQCVDAIELFLPVGRENAMLSTELRTLVMRAVGCTDRTYKSAHPRVDFGPSFRITLPDGTEGMMIWRPERDDHA
jgi:hypothetical protein